MRMSVYFGDCWFSSKVVATTGIHASSEARAGEALNKKIVLRVSKIFFIQPFYRVEVPAANDEVLTTYSYPLMSPQSFLPLTAAQSLRLEDVFFFPDTQCVSRTAVVDVAAVHFIV